MQRFLFLTPPGPQPLNLVRGGNNTSAFFVSEMQRFNRGGGIGTFAFLHCNWRDGGMFFILFRMEEVKIEE